MYSVTVHPVPATSSVAAPESPEVLLPRQYAKAKMFGMFWPTSSLKVPNLACAPRVSGVERHSSGKSLTA